MELSLVQKQALKTFILANYAGQSDEQIANALNQVVSPDYWAWRTSVPKHEVTDTVSSHTDGTPTAFTWGGASGGFINRSQGERDAWRELWNTSLTVNPSLANVRTAFVDIFSGSGAGAVGNRNHLWGVCQRKVTVVEKLFVTATVGGPAQAGARGAKTNPDTLGVEGPISYSEVSEALNS